MIELKKKVSYLLRLEGMIRFAAKRCSEDLNRIDLTEEDLVEIEEMIDTLGGLIESRKALMEELKEYCSN